MLTKQKHRIIIDTNLWISFLLTGNYSKIDSLLNNNDCILLFSKELISEFIEVAQRPKFRKYFFSERLRKFINKNA